MSELKRFRIQSVFTPLHVSYEQNYFLTLNYLGSYVTHSLPYVTYKLKFTVSRVLIV